MPCRYNRRPPPTTPEDAAEAAIEFQAQLMQLHDPDEIRARHWHTNMRMKRVLFSILWFVASVVVYITVPSVVQKLLQ